MTWRPCRASRPQASLYVDNIIHASIIPFRLPVATSDRLQFAERHRTLRQSGTFDLHDQDNRFGVLGYSLSTPKSSQLSYALITSHTAIWWYALLYLQRITQSGAQGTHASHGYFNGSTDTTECREAITDSITSYTITKDKKKIQQESASKTSKKIRLLWTPRRRMTTRGVSK